MRKEGETLELQNDILVARAQKGDADAFEQLILLHEKQIYNVALRVMRDPDDASDMGQEAIIKIYKHLPGFKGDCSFSVWVYRIVTNTCLDELRRRKKRASVSLDMLTEDGAMQFSSDDEGPEQRAERRELSDAIAEAISTLDDDYRVVITLRDVQGLSYQEIAEVTRTNIGTVKSRISRARSQLQRKLRPYLEKKA